MPASTTMTPTRGAASVALLPSTPSATHDASTPASTVMTPSRGTASVALPKTPLRKLSPDNLEGGAESEVETHVSDSSELPSSASAVAAMLEASGASDRSILSEIQRLRQENSALRLENAALRSETSEDSPELLSTTAALVCGTPASRHLRFGAPLRYTVAGRMGESPHKSNFEFGLSDLADLSPVQIRRALSSCS